MPRSVAVDADPPVRCPQVQLERLANALDRAAAIVERDEGCEFGEISVLLVSVERITDLHEQYFADLSPTDIITFPYEHEPHGPIDGDIAICLDVAREHAADDERSLDSELLFLGIHGLLHLAGWDDRSHDDRERMLARQDQILAEVGADAG